MIRWRCKHCENYKDTIDNHNIPMCVCGEEMEELYDDGIYMIFNMEEEE